MRLLILELDRPFDGVIQIWSGSYPIIQLVTLTSISFKSQAISVSV